ncbi:hypothetical protein D3C73_1045280 [compost metagenome]
MPRHSAALAEMLIEVVGQALGAAGFHVKDAQSLYAFTQQRVGHRCPGAPCAHLDHPLHCGVLQTPSETFGKTQAVGVVANALAVFQYHCIYSTDALGFGGQLVEQGKDRLLAREGNVQPGESHLLRRFQQVGQGLAVELQLVEVDQAIQVTQTLGVAFVFMQGGSTRRLDAGSDQSGQYSVVWNHDAHPFKCRLKCSRASR